MPARVPLPQSGEQPKTLFEAKAMLAKLRKLLPGSSAELAMSSPPVPGTAGTVPVKAPPASPRPNPDPSFPGSPGTNLHRKPPELVSPAPRVIGAVLESKTLQELHRLLAAETAKPRQKQDSNMVQCLYREIKKR